MMKLLLLVLHHPLVSLLSPAAALFVLALILPDQQDRRMKRELFAARVRARTLYQHRRLQNEEADWEASRLGSNSNSLPGNGRLAGPFKILRWRWGDPVCDRHSLAKTNIIRQR